jgi:hypothetical protein
MKAFKSIIMTVISMFFLVSLCSQACAENWQLVSEYRYEAIPDEGIDAETEKVYVDVDSIEKDGSLRKYWKKTVTYDFGSQETSSEKVYKLFDCAKNRGATKIFDSGRVVPDHKLMWFPICTGNEPPPTHMFDIKCLTFPEQKLVCEQ